MKKTSSREILDNVSKCLELINNDNICSKKDAYKELNIIAKLLEGLSIDESAKITFKIIKSKPMQKLFSLIIPKDAKEFNSITIPAEFNNDGVKNIINSYCDINDIEYLSGYKDDSDNIKYTESVKLLFKDFDKYKLLSKEEEQELAKKVINGDKQARDLMINSNGKLVFSVAGHFVNRGVEFEDLVSYGLQGLIKGVDKFDPNKGYKFSTYTIWWIRQAITRGINDSCSTIRKPSQAYYEKDRIEKARQEIFRNTGKEPSSKELAYLLDVSEERIENFTRYFQGMLYLDAPLSGEDETCTLGDAISDDNFDLEDSIERKIKEEEFKMFFERSKLTKREKDVLILRFGLNGQPISKLEEIGRKYSLTRERIRQIENNSLDKLRKSAKRNNIKYYEDFYQKSSNGFANTISVNKPVTKANNKPRFIDSEQSINSKKNLYKYFNSYDYTNEEIYMALSKLDNMDMQILTKKYGEDLMNPTLSCLTFQENMKFSIVITKIMNTLMEMEYNKRKEMNKK